VSEIQDAPGIVARRLQEWRNGEAQALERLTAEVYAELRHRAAFAMAGQGNR